MSAYRVRINTSDLAWIKKHATEDDVIPCGTDATGTMFFQVEFDVLEIERVTFAKADMFRFDIGPDAPRDHNRYAMYPRTYLVRDPYSHLVAES